MSRLKMRVAVNLILEIDNKFLLLRRYNTGYADGQYSVVAGHVDGNETIISAMQREALEEAGINIDKNDLKIVEVMHRKSDDESIDYFLYSNKFSTIFPELPIPLKAPLTEEEITPDVTITPGGIGFTYCETISSADIIFICVSSDKKL